MKTPDYIKAGDGFADITLASPATVAGAKVTTVRMREPTVNDQLVGDAMTGSQGEKEVGIFANLLDLTPADVKGMTLRNYSRLQAAYTAFIV